MDINFISSLQVMSMNILLSNGYFRLICYSLLIFLVLTFRHLFPSVLPGMGASYHGWLAIIGVVIYFDLAFRLVDENLKIKLKDKFRSGSFLTKIKIISVTLIQFIAAITLARGLVVSFY